MAEEVYKITAPRLQCKYQESKALMKEGREDKISCLPPSWTSLLFNCVSFHFHSATLLSYLALLE